MIILDIVDFCVSFPVRINVFFDNDVNVFIATSPDVNGLIVEAATKEGLEKEVLNCIDLLSD